METKLTKLENSKVEVLVNVDETTWKDAQAKAFKKVASNVKIDGFRPGKAPEAMVKSKVSQVQVFDEAINNLLPVLYSLVLKENELRPFAQPKVDVTKLSDSELEVKFIIITAPEVKLGAYTGLEIGKKEAKVTEKEVKEAMDQIRQASATLVTKEAEASKGDIVVMDFVGSINGEVFEGGSANNHELELGSGQFIPGFEDQLIGHKAGEDVDVNVTFPENYTPELKGKAALFKCKIHEVKQKKLPDLTDELVKEQKLEGVNTVEEFKAATKERLTQQKTREAKNEYLRKLYDSIVKASEISVADEVIEEQVANRMKDFEAQLSQSNLKMEDYLSIIGQTEDQIKAKFKEDATRDVSTFLALEEIAKAEKITVEDADLEFEYAKLADQYNMAIDDVKKAISASSDEFKHNIKMQRVEDYLYLNNN